MVASCEEFPLTHGTLNPLTLAIRIVNIYATIEILVHCADLTLILSTVSIHWFGKFTSGPPRNLGGPWSKIITSFWAGEALRLK